MERKVLGKIENWREGEEKEARWEETFHGLRVSLLVHMHTSTTLECYCFQQFLTIDYLSWVL